MKGTDYYKRQKLIRFFFSIETGSRERGTVIRSLLKLKIPLNGSIEVNAYGGKDVFFEIHKPGIDALVKVPGPIRLRYGSSRYMIREAAITPKIRKQWLEADPDKYLAAVLAQ